MNQFQERTAVAPRTVTEISEGKHVPAGKPRKPPKRKHGSVVKILPRKDIWMAAKRAAHGNVKRLLVVSEEVVIVCNSEEHRDYLKGVYR